MTSELTAEFYENLSQIIAKTVSGELQWKVINPTTFIYDGPSAKIALQEVPQGPGNIYFFEVIDSSGRKQLEISGVGSTETNKRLRELFFSIRNYKDAKGLAFLKKIIE